MQNKRILIIASHPDDEVLGCGGIISRFGKDNEISVAILGEGATSRGSGQEEVMKLKESATKVENVKEVMFFDLPDNKFDTLPLLDIVKKIENIVEKVKPEIVFTHFKNDLNVDHKITYLAVLTALRPKPDCSVKEIYSFEVPSSTEWSDESFLPDVFFEIDIEDKLKLLEGYQSEMREFPHPRSRKGVEALALFRGCSCGLKAAEAFKLIRKIK